MVHSSRLWPYALREYQSNEALRKQFIEDKGVFEVISIDDSKLTNNQFFVLISWMGFSQEENTWEPLKTLHEDLPAGLMIF